MCVAANAVVRVVAAEDGAKRLRHQPRSPNRRPVQADSVLTYCVGVV